MIYLASDGGARQLRTPDSRRRGNCHYPHQFLILYYIVAKSRCPGVREDLPGP